MNLKKLMAGVCAAVLVWGGFASTSEFSGVVNKDNTIYAQKADVLVLEIDKKKVDKGTKIVTVDVKIADDTNLKIDSIGVSMAFDSRLKLVQTSKAKYMVVNVNDSNNSVVISASDRNYGAGTVITTLTFEVPDEEGIYYINWLETTNMNIIDTASETNGNENFRLESGYIQVGEVDPSTVTEAVATTAETTTTSAVETTKATEASTTAAEETTKATEASTTAAEETIKATEASTTAAKETTKATEASTTAAKETTKATEASTTAAKETTKATEATTTTAEKTTSEISETTTTAKETSEVIVTTASEETTSKQDVITVNYGDINKDGIVDLSDLTALALILMKDIDTSKLDLDAADVNGNGEINIGDLPLLKRFVLGDKSVVLGPQK